MEIFITILIIFIVYFAYQKNKSNKVSKQQPNAMVLAYAQMFYTLSEQYRFIEGDYQKLVSNIWEVDSNLLDYREFNKKWEAICNALDVPVHYIDGSKTNLSDKLVERISARLYDNRHIFQQYIEQSERMKKKTEEIMNDSI